MNRLATVLLILAITFFAAGTASAHVRFHLFGVFPFPSVVVAPAPVYPYPAYYPPYPAYSYRVWIPGYWDWRWTGYGRARVWIPGHWRYRP